MNLLREYIRASLVTERGDADYKEQMVKDIRLSIQTVNDEIESRHPAHAFPNSEHVEGSIGHVLDLISLKKKYGRSRSEHETQAILDKWRGRMGAGSGKGMAAWTLALAGGGLITADMVFLGGTFTAMGLSGAGLNIIHEVMAGNAVDDDLKEYIRWDPKILEWMDDKKEDELEDEWIDLLFEHISKNPKDDLATFISINDFANKKLGRPLTGEKIQIRTNELRKYIRSLLNEATEYDDHFSSMMDSGYEGVKQAMELADSLGMQPQDLPWTKKRVEEYLYDGAVSMGIDLVGPEAQKVYAKLLAQTGWTWEDWMEAGRVEFEAYKKSIGLHEAQYGGPGVEQSIGYGKNYHTVNPQPITWENYEGLSYDVSAEGDGSYYASIQVLDYPELSTPSRSFPDEASAQWWVRDNYEKLHRFLLAQSSV